MGLTLSTDPNRCVECFYGQAGEMPDVSTSNVSEVLPANRNNLFKGVNSAFTNTSV